MMKSVLTLFVVCGLVSISACSKDEAKNALLTEPGKLIVVAAPTLASIIANWPDGAREAVHKMHQKYGLPQELTEDRAVWINNGIWKRTIVSREEIAHNFPKPHTDYLEQVIDYRVPPSKFTELATFDGSVVAERTKGELSAMCDREEFNLLAINLANDIVLGKKTAADARLALAEAVTQFQNGEKPEYTQQFQFLLLSGGTQDTDVALP